jgi:hypothetical protein
MLDLGGYVLDKELYYSDVVGYHPHPGQRILHYTPSRFKVVSNGRRWGKTIFGGREVEPNAYVACHITGGAQIGWIVGPQYTDSEKEFRVVYDSMRKLGIDKDSIKFVNNVDSGSMHIKTSWGFELLGKSAKHPDSLVGEGLNFVLMVEAGRHKRKTWGQYIRPALSDKRGWAIFSGVPEGRSENSLLFALYERGQDPKFRQWKSWKMPSWTNTIVFPGGRQDPEILEAESDLTDDEFNRQYGAEFTDKTGVVLKEYDEDIHVGDYPFNPQWPLYMALDYGFTNPFVVLFIQEGPAGEIVVVRERRFTGIDTPEVASTLIEEEADLIRHAIMIYPDPAEPDDTYTMVERLRIQANYSTGGSKKNRRTMIRQALKERNKHLDPNHPLRRPRLRIDRSCASLRWEMREGWRWPERRSEVTSDKEEPMDKDDHGPEALGRYFRGRFHAPEREGGSFSTQGKMG